MSIVWRVSFSFMLYIRVEDRGLEAFCRWCSVVEFFGLESRCLIALVIVFLISVGSPKEGPAMRW